MQVHLSIKWEKHIDKHYSIADIEVLKSSIPKFFRASGHEYFFLVISGHIGSDTFFDLFCSLLANEQMSHPDFVTLSLFLFMSTMNLQ